MLFHTCRLLMFPFLGQKIVDLVRLMNKIFFSVDWYIDIFCTHSVFNRSLCKESEHKSMKEFGDLYCRPWPQLLKRFFTFSNLL